MSPYAKRQRDRDSHAFSAPAVHKLTVQVGCALARRGGGSAPITPAAARVKLVPFRKMATLGTYFRRLLDGVPSVAASVGASLRGVGWSCLLLSSLVLSCLVEPCAEGAVVVVMDGVIDCLWARQVMRGDQAVGTSGLGVEMC